MRWKNKDVEEEDKDPKFKVVYSTCQMTDVPDMPSMMDLLLALNTPPARKVSKGTPHRKG